MRQIVAGRKSSSIPLLVLMLCIPIVAPQAQTIVDVDISGFAFTPADISVEIGTAVRWTNNHTVLHTSTSDDGIWDSGNLAPGDDYSFTFLATGVYPYHCTFHSLTMTGTVTVQSTGTSTDIDIPGFSFDPADITVEPGTVVTWTNSHSVAHTTTSDVAGIWDSGTLNQGESFSYLFNVVGDYPYHCSFHPSMLGNVSVIIPPSCICGDANSDLIINILDIVHLINYKYKGGTQPIFLECCDVNHDSSIDILDIVHLINFKYKGGAVPDCGF